MADFVELATEGFTAVLETDHGDRYLHYASNLKSRDAARPGDSRLRREHYNGQRTEIPKLQRRSSRQSRRRNSPQQLMQSGPEAPRNEAPTNEKSRRRTNERNRMSQQRAPTFQEPTVDEDEKLGAADKFAAAALAQAQRNAQFRLQKGAYVPPETQNVPRRLWDEKKLHKDVGRAVKEAIARSSGVMVARCGRRRSEGSI